MAFLFISIERYDGGRKIIATIVENLAMAADIEEQAMWHLKYTFMRYERQMEGLGFCLSEIGDLLGQWRGYAQNATGVAIGFSSDSLLKLAKQDGKAQRSLTKIEYDPSAHQLSAESIYQKMLKLIKPHRRALFNKKMANMAPDNYDDQRSSDDIMMSKFALSIDLIYNTLFKLKLPAFAEEQEWRLLDLSVRGGQNYSYRARGNSLVPYIEVDFSKLEHVITEVILGPKHDTSIYIVENLMRQNGYGAKIKPSVASYR